jgi:hypothetical protein
MLLKWLAMRASLGVKASASISERQDCLFDSGGQRVGGVLWGAGLCVAYLLSGSGYRRAGAHQPTNSKSSYPPLTPTPDSVQESLFRCWHSCAIQCLTAMPVRCQERGEVQIKGKGRMRTHWVCGLASDGCNGAAPCHDPGLVSPQHHDSLSSFPLHRLWDSSFVSYIPLRLIIIQLPPNISPYCSSNAIAASLSPPPVRPFFSGSCPSHTCVLTLFCLHHNASLPTDCDLPATYSCAQGGRACSCSSEGRCQPRKGHVLPLDSITIPAGWRPLAFAPLAPAQSSCTRSATYCHHVCCYLSSCRCCCLCCFSHKFCHCAFACFHQLL